MSTLQGRLRSAALAGLGGLGLCVLWQVTGTRGWVGPTLPPMTDVLAYLLSPSRREMLSEAAAATFRTAGIGYLVGCAVGILTAVLSYGLPVLRPGLDRLAGLLNAIPQIAIAPVFIVFFAGTGTGAALSALGTYFVIYIGATVGLAASPGTQIDLFRSFGASKAATFLRLDIFASLPTLVSSMRQAVPIALVGSILGEWFGSNHGLGLLMVTAMKNFNIPLLWSAVLITMAGSGLCFAVLGLVERTVYARYR